MVIISLYSKFLVFFNLINNRLDLVKLYSLCIKLFTISCMLVIKEFLIINFHFFKLLVVNSICFNNISHLIFMLLPLSIDIISDIWNLSINVVSFLNDTIRLVSSIINLFNPLLFFSVKLVLVFSF